VLDAGEIEALRARAGGRGGAIERVEPGAMDGDGDGRLSRAEFADTIPQRLREADRNGDGTLSRRELRWLR